jgi:hypothetical protein
MDRRLHFAYIDEAGSVALSLDNHIIVVAALCTGNPQAIVKVIRKIRKKYLSPGTSGELKAKKESNQLVEALLTSLARETIEIYTVIIDRKIIQAPPQDPENIYRWVAARLVAKLVKQYPAMEITLDRRYTKEHLRYSLERSIREEISDLPQQYLLIRQEDSVSIKGLQAVDFVAWAMYQKYERGDNHFHQLIEPVIIEEELITKKVWEQEYQ